MTTGAVLPVGEVNYYYDQFLQGSSCSGSLNWSPVSGSNPLNLGSNGEISGTPGNPGNYLFIVQANDGVHSTNKQFSLTISNALQVTTSSLPDGTNGLAYNQSLAAIYGVPFAGVPYSWSVTSGSLPPGLNLATNGVIAGTNSGSGQVFFTVEAADSLGAVYDQDLSINVASSGGGNPPPALIIGSGGGQFLIGWPASAGTNFTLQMTTNLQNGPWVPATGAVPAVSFLVTNNQPAVFFRLQ